MTTLLSFINIAALVNLALQVSLLGIVALVVLQLFGGSAVKRYGIAYSCLLATAALSVSSLYLQSKDINLLALEIELPAIDAVTLKEMSSWTTFESAAEFSVAPPPAVDLDLSLAESGLALDGIGSQVSVTSLAIALLLTLILVWAAGVLVAWLKIGFAAINMRTLLAQSQDIAGAEFKKLHRVLNLFPDDIRHSSIRVSNELSSPVQVGFLKSLILLPDAFLSQSNENHIRAVLLHEYAHWHRRDNFANLLQKLVAALFWWHPLIHQLDRIASRAREEVCDNYVLREIDPVEYGETLLLVNSLLGDCTDRITGRRNVLAAGIVDQSWSLEQRIGELIDNNRERSMKLSTSSFSSIVLSVFAIALIIAALSITPLSEPVIAQSAQDNPDAEPRTVPQARTALTLSQQVFDAIEEIQELLSPESATVEADPEAAKAMLDTLYDDVFESANDFEKSTILNFYTNYYLMQRDYPGAIERFEALLQIENLRSDQKLRTLRSLGQLYGQQQRWQQSIDAFQAWINEGGELDSVVARGLSYAHYNLESWGLARDYWQRYLAEFAPDNPDRDDLAYLNGLHFQLEDYEAALELTKDMILRFDNQTDWDNLRALQRELERMDSLADLDPDLGGTLDLGSPEPEIAFATVIPTDGDYLPLVAIAPMYPRVAADEGTEGWVLLEFTVTPQGDVDEESIAVVDAEPADVFNRTSIRALSDFVFAPRMQDGEAVAVPGVQYLFRFRLEDEDA